MNNDDGVEEIDSLTSSLSVPVCPPSLSISLHPSKEAERAMKQRLCRGCLSSLVWYRIREDEVLHWDERSPDVSWNSRQFKFSWIRSQSFENWKMVALMFTRKFLNYELFSLQIEFESDNPFDLYKQCTHPTFVPEQTLVKELTKHTENTVFPNYCWISSDGVQNEIILFRDRQRWRRSRCQRRAGCTLHTEAKL